MNTSLSLDLVAYGALLLGASVLPHYFTTGGLAPTLWVGITGGTLAALLGLLGFYRYPVRRWGIVVMMLLGIVLLVQAGMGWWAAKAGETKVAAVIPTALAVLTIGQLVNLIQNRSSFTLDADEPQDPNNEPE